MARVVSSARRADAAPRERDDGEANDHEAPTHGSNFDTGERSPSEPAAPRLSGQIVTNE
jgi:hypothetical protein